MQKQRQIWLWNKSIQKQRYSMYKVCVLWATRLTMQIAWKENANNAKTMIIVLDIEVIEVENTMTEEQIENIKSQIIEMVKPVMKAIIQIYEKIKEILFKKWSKIYEYIKIYRRTKNKRIKKKQIAKIEKILQKY